MIFSRNKDKDMTSLSISQKRWIKFKSMKRGYYSLIIIISLYAISWLLPILVNNKAIIISYNNEIYFPAIHDFSLIPDKTFLGKDK